MKRIIYKPANNESIPSGAMFYILPANGAVVDALVDDNFVTAGTVLYDSLNGIMLNEPFIHHFDGWAV